jgi:Sulfotransferase family
VSEQVRDHRDEWIPPPRPDWVTRLIAEGECMDISGVVPLDEKSLLSSAIQATGLSDFGADDWREPFQVFIKSLEQDADLTLVGRLRSRAEILNLLEARLQIESTYKAHPEINDERIEQPIIVVGQGRSGTSFLVNLLAAIPENGALLHWEAMYPCPPPEKATYTTDPRIEKADRYIRQINRVAPTMESMHEFDARLSIEDVVVQSINFMGPSWLGCFGQVASYDAYMARQDMMPSLRYHERVLKLLQWKNPRKRWVLKDVLFLDQMPLILKLHPDACFVWPHRDPVRALASTVSLIGTFQWAGSNHPFKGGSYEFATDMSYAARRLDSAIEMLESGAVPSSRIHHLLYTDLVRDPLEVVATLYRHFNIPIDEKGLGSISDYLRRHPRDNRPPHRFSAGSEHTIQRARAAFKRYQDYFDVPSE